MQFNGRTLAQFYKRAHNQMRDVDGLLPMEAFDELLKFLFVKELMESGSVAVPTADAMERSIPASMRSLFADMICEQAPWAEALWSDKKFHLSDRSLLNLHSLFKEVTISNIPLDIRSSALHVFLRSGARRGLGIFLTPEDVVRAIVNVIQPRHDELVLDPACGSGTFLIESIRHILKQSSTSEPVEVFGIEKNPRLLLLAELNLGSWPQVRFNRTCVDSLRVFSDTRSSTLTITQDSVDVIVTNPPFGVSVTQEIEVPSLFGTENTIRVHRSTTPSEVLFLKLCMRLLRPGGRLGIILPRSVLTNASLDKYRRSIDRLGYLTALISLPAETFSSSGTSTSTVAAFFRKYSRNEKTPRFAKIPTCFVKNVGFDNTGRERSGNELIEVADRLHRRDGVKSPVLTVHRRVPVRETLQHGHLLLSTKHGRRTGTPLKEFICLANTGMTPSRSSYTDDGMFVVKVGNLTGRGIDWEPRERNFVSDQDAIKRSNSRRLSLRIGDILLTSSAHASRYIAKKVDIVFQVPSRYTGLGVSFVGELIRVRSNDDVDPFVLLAALRRATVRRDLQASVRGQTAHLHVNDLLEVAAPCDLRRPTQRLKEAARLFKRESELAFELSMVSHEAADLLNS